MTEIVLTAEQLKIVAESEYDVPAFDEDGNFIGHIAPYRSPDNMTEEEIIKECKRRLASNQRRIPSAEVLKGLDEILKAKQS